MDVYDFPLSVRQGGADPVDDDCHRSAGPQLARKSQRVLMNSRWHTIGCMLERVGWALSLMRRPASRPIHSGPFSAIRPTKRSLLLAVLLFATSACVSSAQPAAPTVLRVVMTDDWANTHPFLDVVRDFERRHPGVRVSVDETPINQVLTKVIAAFNAGSPIDVAQSHAATAAG